MSEAAASHAMQLVLMSVMIEKLMLIPHELDNDFVESTKVWKL